jgi:hypothetical protein
MSHRLSIKRVLDYFREADSDEVRVVAQLAAEILTARKVFLPQSTGVAAANQAPKPRRRRATNGAQSEVGAASIKRQDNGGEYVV